MSESTNHSLIGCEVGSEHSEHNPPDETIL